MKIDIILEPDLTPQEICDLGLIAESYGVDSIWTSNYFSHWDPFISLTQLANQSSEVKLGVLAVSPFEMHPLKIANSLLTLNEVSQGRAQVAVGAGEGNLTAMNLKTPKKIVLAVREALEIIIKACSDDLKEGYIGEIFNVSLPCDYGWAKHEKPVVYGTAYRHMMMRMEGRVADGVYIGATPPEVLEEAIININTGKEKRLDGDEEILIKSVDDFMQIDFYKDDFYENLLNLDKEENIFLLCRSGRRSGLAAKFLTENGYSKIYNIKGGINSIKD